MCVCSQWIYGCPTKHGGKHLSIPGREPVIQTVYCMMAVNRTPCHEHIPLPILVGNTNLGIKKLVSGATHRGRLRREKAHLVVLWL